MRFNHYYNLGSQKDLILNLQMIEFYSSTIKSWGDTENIFSKKKSNKKKTIKGRLKYMIESIKYRTSINDVTFTFINNNKYIYYKYDISKRKK